MNHQHPVKMKNKRPMLIAIMVALLLCVPFLAMRFTDDVRWTAFDLLVAAFLLSGAGLALELVLRKAPNVTTRIALCAVVLVVLVLTWAELAVGIFGTPFAGS